MGVLPLLDIGPEMAGSLLFRELGVRKRYGLSKGPTKPAMRPDEEFLQGYCGVSWLQGPSHDGLVMHKKRRCMQVRC